MVCKTTTEMQVSLHWQAMHAPCDMRATCDMRGSMRQQELVTPEAPKSQDQEAK